MHPVLFTIPVFGGITIHTYGILVATGFLVGMWWGGYDARRRGENPSRIMDMVFYMILSGLVVSRLHYILVVDPGMFWRAPLDVFKIWQGGITFYGGVVGGVIGVAVYVWWYKLSFWTCADIVAPGLSLGHAFGRIGCLMAGCCHGREAPADAWYAIRFPEGVGSLAPVGTALYPTQIMESLGEVGIFLFLLWMGRRQKFSGQIFLLYLIIYAVMRYTLEFWRGDVDRGWWIEPIVSTSQGIAIVMATVGVILYMWRRRYAQSA
jgi:phosphatidylglycerol:prolipoprotein diacylglycerol transferase